MNSTTAISRRRLIGSVGALGVAAITGSLAAACSAAAAKPVPMVVHKDPNCGCCAAWAERMTATGDFAPTLVDEADMAGVKTRLRVPPQLVSCHTTEIDGYAIEGHVPAADIARLLRDKPMGIIGLAVPGMPAGSPGMEMPDSRRDAFEVLAFKADGSASVYARYA